MRRFATGSGDRRSDWSFKTPCESACGSLWPGNELSRIGQRHTHSKYFADTPSLAGLQSWKAEFRYYDGDHSDYPASSEQDWKTASLEIQSALDAAILDGHPIY